MQLVYIGLVGLGSALAVGLVGGLILRVKARREHTRLGVFTVERVRH